SVLPSRALTVKGAGGFHPIAASFEVSVRSSVRISRPSLSRTDETGGVSGVDAASTKNRPEGENLTSCVALVGVSRRGGPPSKPTRYKWTKYGSRPFSRPTARK